VIVQIGNFVHGGCSVTLSHWLFVVGNNRARNMVVIKLHASHRNVHIENAQFSIQFNSNVRRRFSFLAPGTDSDRTDKPVANLP